MLLANPGPEQRRTVSSGKSARGSWAQHPTSKSPAMYASPRPVSWRMTTRRKKSARSTRSVAASRGRPPAGQVNVVPGDQQPALGT